MEKPNPEGYPAVAPKLRYLPTTTLQGQVKKEPMSTSYPPSLVSDSEPSSEDAMYTLTNL